MLKKLFIKIFKKIKYQYIVNVNQEINMDAESPPCYSTLFCMILKNHKKIKVIINTRQKYKSNFLQFAYACFKYC